MRGPAERRASVALGAERYAGGLLPDDIPRVLLGDGYMRCEPFDATIVLRRWEVVGEPGGVGTNTVPAEERLGYEGKVFINFRNHTYQWVSVKLFALPADADDHEVLALLIRHVCYRDSYGGTGEKDMETIHGPYWLSAITPEAFSPVSASDAEALIRTWAEYAAPLPDGRREEMEKELYPRIRNATSRYQLPDLRDTAEHDWGNFVGSLTGFFEFVLIDRRAGTVALVVASDD